MRVEKFSFVADDGDYIDPSLICLKCNKTVESYELKSLNIRLLHGQSIMPVVMLPLEHEITVFCHGETETAVRRVRIPRMPDHFEEAEELPNDLEDVEIFVEGKWLPAVFYASDESIGVAGDDSWWNDYFMLEDGRTFPEDVQAHDASLPQWRRP